jgi:cysteine desulfurase/selenocysteine lyase
MSNVLGRPQNFDKIIAAARAKNPDVITILDAAQYVVHEKIDVSKIGCDFLCFSGHKIGADTGVGVMYISDRFIDMMPDKFGGGIVDGELNLLGAPMRWESGTLPLTQIIGMASAIDYLGANRPDHNLIKYLYGELSKNNRIKIITGPDSNVLTFYISDMHPLDFGALIGAHGVCLRVGNMCASWLHRKLGLDGYVRISAGFWNTMAEMEQVAKIINNIVK